MRRNRNTNHNLSAAKNANGSIILHSNNRGLSQPMPSTSYGHSSQQHSSQRIRKSPVKKLNHQEEMQLAANVVKYLLAADQNKRVISKMYIVKNVLQDSITHYRQVIEKAKQLLSQVFGYKLIDDGKNKYILVNEIEHSRSYLRFSEEKMAQRALLFIVLAHIYMSDGSCKESSLWDFLQNLSIINEGVNHHFFGNVKGSITGEFIEQGYLEVITEEDLQKNTGELQVLYKWGIRALNELPPRAILEFMSEVYGNCALNSWPEQFKRMEQWEQCTDS